MELLIFTPHPTPRHRYVFALLFEEMLGFELRWTEDVGTFEAAAGPKFSYAQPADGPADFEAHPLLWERGVSLQNQLPIEGEPCPVRGGRWSFDPFAAAFRLVTRYEEYLPHAPDAHGRFPDNDNWLVRRGWADRPLVNEWAAALYR
ncbi:MAG: hypothetical protein WBA12_01225, partial [Catalinimonas sp.]